MLPKIRTRCSPRVEVSETTHVVRGGTRMQRRLGAHLGSAVAVMFVKSQGMGHAKTDWVCLCAFQVSRSGGPPLALLVDEVPRGLDRTIVPTHKVVVFCPLTRPAVLLPFDWGWAVSDKDRGCGSGARKTQGPRGPRVYTWDPGIAGVQGRVAGVARAPGIPGDPGIVYPGSLGPNFTRDPGIPGVPRTRACLRPGYTVSKREDETPKLLWNPPHRCCLQPTHFP